MDLQSSGFSGLKVVLHRYVGEGDEPRGFKHCMKVAILPAGEKRLGICLRCLPLNSGSTQQHHHGHSSTIPRISPSVPQQERSARVEGGPRSCWYPTQLRFLSRNQQRIQRTSLHPHTTPYQNALDKQHVIYSSASHRCRSTQRLLPLPFTFQFLQPKKNDRPHRTA